MKTPHWYLVGVFNNNHKYCNLDFFYNKSDIEIEIHYTKIEMKTPTELINEISLATNKYELKDIYNYIFERKDSYCSAQLIIIDDTFNYKIQLINIDLTKIINELSNIAKDWMSIKEYQIANLYTEMGEDYLKELEFKI